MELIRLNRRVTEESVSCSANKEDMVVRTNDTIQPVTPKSQKQNPSDVKRWASVVKAQEKIESPAEPNICEKQQGEGIEITPDIIDCIFKTFPKTLENHKGFIVTSKNLFSCNVCSVKLDSLLGISNHLKTRKHEDNIIKSLKEKIPHHLQQTMDFVSFFGFSLCCNLCRCKIDMSSHNLFETIVSIIAHNSDEGHTSHKAYHETYTHDLLQSIAKNNPEVKESLHFIDKKMIPQFTCKLCNKNILHDKSNEILTQNFIRHLKSVGHTKHQRAIEILKLFHERSINGKDSFIVLNGNLYCTYCNHQVETDLAKLISHENGVEHAKNVFKKMEITSFNKVSGNKMIANENKINEAKCTAVCKTKYTAVCNIKCTAVCNTKKDDIDEKENSQQFSERKQNPGSRLVELLNTIPLGLTHIDYMIENDKGSVTCLICNRVVPPSTYNLQTHLLGINHKKNVELKKVSKSEEIDSKDVSYVSTKQDAEEMNTNNDSVLPNTTVNVNAFMTSFTGNNINYFVNNDKGELICFICQCCVTPDPDSLDKHVISTQHKIRVKLWLKNCPDCPKGKSNLVKNLPNSLRTYKCHTPQIIPSAIVEYLYDSLIKKNSFVSENVYVLVKNVDGRHTYCRRCKCLIPLSLDLNVLENNVVLHLKGKRHTVNDAEQDNKDTVSPNMRKIVRSLFTFTDGKQSNLKEKFTKLQNFQVLPNVDFEDRSHTSTVTTDAANSPLGQEVKDDRTSHQAQQSKQTNQEINIKAEFSDESHKNTGAEICISSKKGTSDQTCFKNSKNLKPSKLTLATTYQDFPVSSHLLKIEEETDEGILNRRQKQIDYGKNTEGYSRYCQAVPQRKRSMYRHPVTPPKHLKCSRRNWDGMVRAWRKLLHSWDPPATALDSDIQPLPSQTD